MLETIQKVKHIQSKRRPKHAHWFNPDIKLITMEEFNSESSTRHFFIKKTVQIRSFSLASVQPLIQFGSK